MIGLASLLRAHPSRHRTTDGAFRTDAGTSRSQFDDTGHPVSSNLRRGSQGAGPSHTATEP